MGDEQELDRLIEGALTQYTAAAPLDGLEQRVLGRVSGSRQSRWRGWHIALASAAALAAAIILVIHADERAQTGPPRVAGVIQPRAAITETSARMRPVRAARTRPRRLIERPRLPQLPSPAALTAEERSLLAFITVHPDQAGGLADALRDSAAELSFPALDIEPLPSDGSER